MRKGREAVFRFLSIGNWLRLILGASRLAVGRLPPVLNRSYNVQLRWKKSASGGVGELWEDGTLVCSITGENTAAYGNTNQAGFGLPELYNCGATSVYCHECAVSRTKIG